MKTCHNMWRHVGDMSSCLHMACLFRVSAPPHVAAYQGRVGSNVAIYRNMLQHGVTHSLFHTHRTLYTMPSITAAVPPQHGLNIFSYLVRHETTTDNFSRPYRAPADQSFYMTHVLRRYIELIQLSIGAINYIVPKPGTPQRYHVSLSSSSFAFVVVRERCHPHSYNFSLLGKPYQSPTSGTYVQYIHDWVSIHCHNPTCYHCHPVKFTATRPLSNQWRHPVNMAHLVHNLEGTLCLRVGCLGLLLGRNNLPLLDAFEHGGKALGLAIHASEDLLGTADELACIEVWWRRDIRRCHSGMCQRGTRD